MRTWRGAAMGAWVVALFPWPASAAPVALSSHAFAPPPSLPAGEPAPTGDPSAPPPADGTAPPDGAPAEPPAEPAPPSGATEAGVSGDASVDLGSDAQDEVAEASGESGTDVGGDAAAEDADWKYRTTAKGKKIRSDAIVPNDPGMIEGRREPMMPTRTGPIGLFHTSLPDAGGRYSFRFRLYTDFFRKEGFIYEGADGPDQHSRVRGSIALGFSPLPWTELFFSIGSQANRNERVQEGREDAEAVFALGDITFGAKGAYRFKKGIGLGGQLGVDLLSGSTSLRTTAANVWFDGLFAVDIRYLTKKHVPFRFTTNIGWIFDQSLKVADFGSIDDDTSQEVTRFTLGANHSRVRMRYAIDFPIHVGKKKQIGIDPIVEWAWDVATVQEPAFAQEGAAPSPLPRSSQWLTLGLRANVVSGLFLDAGVDIGMVSPSFEWGPPVPPWQMILGVGWSFDPNPKVEKIEVPAEAPPPESKSVLEGRVVGQVVDPNGAPIPDAKLLFPGAAANAILTDANGAFTTYRFPAGTVTIQVEVNGQVAAEQTAEVKDGEDTNLQIQLTTTPAPPTGIVQGSVTDSAGKAVAFTMQVVGQGVDEPFSSTEDGRIALELLAGDYRGTIKAPGFKDKDITFTVQGKGTIEIKETLERDAPVSTPNVSGTKNSIKLKKKIAYNGNEVSPKSHPLLDELAAFLNGHSEYTLVEIGVHTDDRGAAQQRSDERAESVKSYLVSKGVAADRLSAKGYGASKPVAVNMTDQGRAKNNRTVLTVKK